MRKSIALQKHDIAATAVMISQTLRGRGSRLQVFRHWHWASRSASRFSGLAAPLFVAAGCGPMGGEQLIRRRLAMPRFPFMPKHFLPASLVNTPPLSVQIHIPGVGVGPCRARGRLTGNCRWTQGAAVQSAARILPHFPPASSSNATLAVAWLESGAGRLGQQVFCAPTSDGKLRCKLHNYSIPRSRSPEWHPKLDGPGRGRLLRPD